MPPYRIDKIFCQCDRFPGLMAGSHISDRILQIFRKIEFSESQVLDGINSLAAAVHFSGNWGCLIQELNFWLYIVRFNTTNNGVWAMMLAVFALLSLALVLGWFGQRSIALVCIVLCLGLAVKEFLWEIYSPEYGFRMPWIQTRYIDGPPVADRPVAYRTLEQARGGRA